MCADPTSVCIDSAQAWSRAQKAALEDAGGTTGVVSDDLFDVAYARGLDSFSAFGTTVVLTLHEGDAAPANDQSARPRSLVSCFWFWFALIGCLVWFALIGCWVCLRLYTSVCVHVYMSVSE